MQQASNTIQSMLQVKQLAATCRNMYRYLLSVPPTYNQDSAEKWPLIVFLHGAGETGTNIEFVKIHGMPRLVRVYDDWKNGRAKLEDIEGEKEAALFMDKRNDEDDREDDPCVVRKRPVNLECAKIVAENFITVSPQAEARTGERWEANSIIKLIEEVKSSYKVDPDRIYLTGVSMGGNGTLKIAITHPVTFAAIVPICGWERNHNIEKLKDVPTWLFHGAMDDIIPVEDNKKIYDKLIKIGGEARITVYPKATHDSWTETYNNPEIYKWLLDHKRSPSK